MGNTNYAVCAVCKGLGVIRQTDTDYDDCRHCNGTGRVPVVVYREEELWVTGRSEKYYIEKIKELEAQLRVKESACQMMKGEIEHYLHQIENLQQGYD